MADDILTRVELAGDPSSAALRINGHLLPFSAAVLRLEAPNAPMLSVALPVIGGAVVTLDAKTGFAEETRVALVAMGWTPPEDGGESDGQKLLTLRSAVRRVLDDEESQHPATDGGRGWGPDVTMVAVLAEAMETTAP
jgi:hypothetical protein